MTTRSTLHTKDEAAEILRVKVGWLERQAAARRVPFTMLGGEYRFTDDHLEQIIRLYEKVPGAEPPSRRRNRTARRRASDTAAPTLTLQPRPRKGPRRRTEAA